MALVFPHIVTTLAIIGSGDRFPVRRIYCVGRNYLEHIREMKEGDERDLPFFFQKPTDSIVSEGEVVPYPPATEDFQYEVELVAAIGKSARNIPVAEALDVVFGYAAGVDLTRRDRQRESFKKGLPVGNRQVLRSFGAVRPSAPGRFRRPPARQAASPSASTARSASVLTSGR